jgi:hypothetical protein
MLHLCKGSSHKSHKFSSALYQSNTLRKLLMIISKTNYSNGNRINATNVMQKWQKKLSVVQWIESGGMPFRGIQRQKTWPIKMWSFVQMNSMSHTKLERHYSVCPLNESGSTRNRCNLKPVSNTGLPSSGLWQCAVGLVVVPVISNKCSNTIFKCSVVHEECWMS